MSDPKRIPRKTFATASTKEDEMRAVLLWAVGIPIPVINPALPVPRCLTIEHLAFSRMHRKVPLRADASCFDSRHP